MVSVSLLHLQVSISYEGSNLLLPSKGWEHGEHLALM